MKKGKTGLWVPDKDTYFYERPSYEDAEFAEAMRVVSAFRPDMRTAIDVGAHVGFWTTRLCKKFKRVVAFEPITDHAECLKKNCEQPNYKLYKAALGIREKKAVIDQRYENSGSSAIVKNPVNPVEIDMVRLDDILIDNPETGIDFIKIDVEGHEHELLQGCVHTIKTHKPVIMLDLEKDTNHDTTLGFLKAMGYRKVGQSNTAQVWVV